MKIKNGEVADTHALKAFHRLVEKIPLKMPYTPDMDGFKDFCTVTAALQRSEEINTCPDCGSPMIEVCSGIEKISREGCNPETKALKEKVDGLVEALGKSIATQANYYSGVGNQKECEKYARLCAEITVALKQFSGEEK